MPASIDLKFPAGGIGAQPNFATIEPYKTTGAAMYFSGSAGFCKKRYPLRGCYLRMGTSIAQISQSEIAQFAFGKLGAPSPPSSSYAGGVSPPAGGDSGLCPKNTQAFEKA